jgi:phosphopantetheine adenylyltransferase
MLKGGLGVHIITGLEEVVRVVASKEFVVNTQIDFNIEALINCLRNISDKMKI